MFAALAAIAVRTERVVLGTMVTPLVRRRPWVVARQAAAVDQLSGGRMVLGVGLGDTGESVGVDASFTHFGEERDPRRRAEMLDEALAIVSGLWTGQPFSFHGQHYDVGRAGAPLGRLVPLPPRRPAHRPRRRPRPPSPRGRAPVRHRGRRRGRLEDPDAERDRIRAVAEAGATWWDEYVAASDRETMRAAVARGPIRID